MTTFTQEAPADYMTAEYWNWYGTRTLPRRVRSVEKWLDDHRGEAAGECLAPPECCPNGRSLPYHAGPAWRLLLHAVRQNGWQDVPRKAPKKPSARRKRQTAPEPYNGQTALLARYGDTCRLLVAGGLMPPTFETWKGRLTT